MSLQQSLEQHHPHSHTNIQQQWTEFKNQISSLACQTAKTQLAKMTNKVNALKRDIMQLNQNPQLDNNHDI